MSTNQPGAGWEDNLSSIDDEHEAKEYAKSAVHEPLAEAHARAERVLELEKARDTPRPAVIAHAQKSADIMKQAMGMWV